MLVTVHPNSFHKLQADPTSTHLSIQPMHTLKILNSPARSLRLGLMVRKLNLPIPEVLSLKSAFVTFFCCYNFLQEPFLDFWTFFTCKQLIHEEKSILLGYPIYYMAKLKYNYVLVCYVQDGERKTYSAIDSSVHGKQNGAQVCTKYVCTLQQHLHAF